MGFDLANALNVKCLTFPVCIYLSLVTLVSRIDSRLCCKCTFLWNWSPRGSKRSCWHVLLAFCLGLSLQCPVGFSPGRCWLLLWPQDLSFFTFLKNKVIYLSFFLLWWSEKFLGLFMFHFPCCCFKRRFLTLSMIVLLVMRKTITQNTFTHYKTGLLFHSHLRNNDCLDFS